MKAKGIRVFAVLFILIGIAAAVGAAMFVDEMPTRLIIVALCVLIAGVIAAILFVAANNKEKREISVTLYGTRYNTFGTLHNCDETNSLKKSHPNSWRVEGNLWSDEYQTKPFGILKSPEIFE